MGAVRTTCAYCGVGCGIVATPAGDRQARIQGDTDHPANRGLLCSKGTHLGETIGLEGRLLHPIVDGARSDWDNALHRIADAFGRAIEEHGPDSVAFYVSGQLLTEDYYAANKLMKGFIGSGNIDTNSRLCMSSAVAAHLRAFGEDVVPASYDDLDEADLIILVGSNTAWCHPVVWQRIEAARSRCGTKLVVIDPRRTETAEQADLHLALRPGTDVALFNGALAALRDRGALDHRFMAGHVSQPDGFVARLDADVAGVCDVAPGVLRRFYDLLAATPRTVTLFSQGVNQSLDGTDKANAIINLHLATGRIGKPGAAPFSITGQPNAMGGREVGGLASTLAAHMDFSPANVDRVGRFWNAPAIARRPGLKAVDLFRAVGEGRIKALWIMGTNPAVSMPDAGAVRAALAQCPFVAVSDIMADTDTTRFADVLVPAAGWGEKDGTVTNSDRTISRQRGFLKLPGEARPDWWIISEVARRMGFGAAFGWPDAAAVFREHAALTAFDNGGARRLDLGALSEIDDAAYDALEPTQWGGERPFADGRFAHEDGKARIVAVTQRPLEPHALVLNTGRYRDQWHTMTRTGLSPRLSQHRREPLVEIHGEDAAAAGVQNGDLARVSAPRGEAVFRVELSSGQRKGEIFTPIHWTDRQSAGGRTGLLPAGDVDPHSGQPGFKRTSVSLEKVTTEWRGFLLSALPPREDPACLYWTRVTVPGGQLIELAGTGDAEALAALLPPGERVEAIDTRRGSRRIAVLSEGRLAAALFFSRSGELPDRSWLIGQLSAADPALGLALLAGRPAKGHADRGQIVCACFDLGLKTIVTAIATQNLVSVEAIGRAIGAGSNCGSCRPSLARLLAQTGARDVSA